MLHFATPRRPAQQTTSSLRASQYKRKRDGSPDPPASPDHDHEHDHNDPEPRSPSAVLPVLSASEREQRHVAGLLSDDAFQVPAPPFPHAPPRTRHEKFTSTTVQQELASFTPPVYAVGTTSWGQPVGAKSNAPALRKTHLDVLSTVMHRCLLEGDYDRAARAWGMMIRTQTQGFLIEPRYNGLWGMGAEILLRRGSSDQSSQASREGAPAEQPEATEVFSDRGFELAREYYERLILQYPIRKSNPNAIYATTFYPPFFSVWITQILETSKRARQQYKQLSPQASETAAENHAMTSEEIRAREEEIRFEELRGAKEIRERLNQLVESPPYDKDPQSLGLRGNVGLWISDLIVGRAGQQEQDHNYESDSDNEDESDDISEKITKSDISLREIVEARRFFVEASSISSGPSYDAIANIDIRISELKGQVERLRMPGDAAYS